MFRAGHIPVPVEAAVVCGGGLDKENCTKTVLQCSVVSPLLLPPLFPPSSVSQMPFGDCVGVGGF